MIRAPSPFFAGENGDRAGRIGGTCAAPTRRMTKTMGIARSVLRLAFLCGVAASLGACSSVDGAGGDGDPAGVSEEDALTLNGTVAYRFFLQRGLTSIQAAAVVGNLMQESQVSPTAEEPGGPGRGIAQWSAGGRWNASSQDNVVWYARQQGQSEWSLPLQLSFVWYELQNFPGYGLDRLRSARTLSEAVIAFQTDFEACGTCDQSRRISYAKQVLATY